MKVIDDFVDVNTQQEIENHLLGNTFSWSYCRRIVSTDVNSRSQLVHMFYNYGFEQSNCRPIMPLLATLHACALIKIKANLQLRTEVCYSNKPHIDHKFPNALTGIYYVNDNDGYTVVGETKVESKRGRIVIFPSDTYHYGTSSHQDRCVININYFPQYNEY